MAPTSPSRRVSKMFERFHVAAGGFSGALIVCIVFGGLVLLSPRALADSSIYDGLGGADGVSKIVATATQNFLKDPRIGHTFSETNMARFEEHLGEQLCKLSGGPCDYTGLGMYDAHRGLHLKRRDFSALVEDLQDAMDTHDVPFAVQNRLLAILAPMHREIVTD